MRLQTRLVALLLITAPVFAGPPVAGGALGGERSARAEDAEKARQLFVEGSKFYDVGQFDKAIEAWQQGYDQKPDPSFLFNIAQAYRQKDDPQKAIFFYKSYLRNSPKAQNKAEVEQRIASLQKQVDSGKAVPPPAVAPAPVTPLAPPPLALSPPPPVVAPPPPPVEAQPAPAPAPETAPQFPPAYPPSAPEIAVASPPEAPALAPPRHVDALAGVGSAFWSSGPRGTASPSFAFTLGAGYAFGSRPAPRLRFRLGALFGYTFLHETSSTESFLSFLIDPTLEIRLGTGERWFLSGDIAFGGMAISGLKSTSVLLVQGEQLKVNGTQGMFLTRVGVSVAYRLMPSLAFFAWPAIASSPQKDHFNAAIVRFELLAGAQYRF